MYVVTIANDGFEQIVSNEYSRISGGKITKKKNEIPSFTFDIYPDNDAYDALGAFETTIKVFDRQLMEYVFDGRVLADPSAMDSDGEVKKSVTCEGLLGYLCDSRQGYLEEKLWEGDRNRNGLQEYIDYILSVHNAHLPSYKHVFRGNVDVQTFRTTENVTKGTNFQSTYECLMEKIVNVYGGEIQCRRGSDGKIYLDYCEVLGERRTTPIKLGLNLGSSERSLDPSNVITRLYPRGAKISDKTIDENGVESEVETERRIDITSVNNGVAYLRDTAAEAVYGIIEGVQDWDDVTDPKNLADKAREWLEANNRLPISTKVSALDLSLIDEEFERFRLYDWHSVINPLNDIDETLEIVGQTIDLENPPESTIEFGDTSTLQTKRIKILESLKGNVEYLESQTKTNEVNIGYYVKYTKAAIEIAEDRIVSTVGEQLVQIGATIDVIESRVSTIEQTADSIILSVQNLRSDMETGQQFLESKIEQTAESVTIKVTEAANSYTDGQFAIVNKAVSEIKTTVDGITLSVSNGQLGSTASIKMTVGGKSTTQDIDLSSVRDAFANDKSAITIEAGTITFNSNTFIVDSTYFKVTRYGVITATSGTIGGFTIGATSIYNDYVTLYNNGIRIKDDGTIIGQIGTNHYSSNETIRGLVFDLEYAGHYMAWAAEKTSTATSYLIQMHYANKRYTVNGITYDADTLYHSCDVNFQYNTLFKAKLDRETCYFTDAYTGTVRPATGGTMTFSRGLLIARDQNA